MQNRRSNNKPKMASTTVATQPLRLLSLPLEILRHIASFVVSLHPTTIFLIQLRSPTTESEWLFRTDTQARSFSAFLNLAKTCRQLYQTSIDLAYAKNVFNFSTLVVASCPRPLMAFRQQIGSVNAGYMTSAQLSGPPPSEELKILGLFQGLRKLRIFIPAWDEEHPKEQAFCSYLRNMRADDVPSLRRLYIDIQKDQEGDARDRRDRLFANWTRIERAVDGVRETLLEGGSRAEVRLFETEHWLDGDHFVEMRRRYISEGVYEPMDDA